MPSLKQNAEITSKALSQRAMRLSSECIRGGFVITYWTTGALQTGEVFRGRDGAKKWDTIENAKIFPTLVDAMRHKGAYKVMPADEAFQAASSQLLAAVLTISHTIGA